MGGETDRTGNDSILRIQNLTQPQRQPNPFETNLFETPPTFADSRRDRMLGGDLLQFRLNQNFTGTQPTVAPAVVPQSDPAKIEAALKTIRGSLSESFTDWDVSHGDLAAIQTAFKDLNAAEQNEVFSQLTDGELKKWTSELSGTLGGYERTEKQQLFGELAANLSGENLARLGKNLGNDGFDLLDLGAAIGQNASPEAKVAFVQNMAGTVENNRAASEAVANVIIGLQNNPAALDQALGALGDKQLEKLMSNISIVSYSPGYGVQTTEYHGELLEQMLSAVSKSQNAEIKARIFNAAATHLKAIEDAPNLMPANAIIGKNEAAAHIRDGLTSIINSDTTGIVNNLTFNPENRNGEGLTAYLKSMLNGGKTTEIGGIIARLARGNQTNVDQTARFQQYTTDRDGNKIYENAQMLGYFTGALLAANKQIGNDTAKQADLLKKVFSTAAGAMGVSGVGSFAFDQTLDQVTSAVVDDISKGRSAKVGELLKLTVPQLAGNDAFYRSEVFNQYENRVDHVLVQVLVR